MSIKGSFKKGSLDMLVLALLTSGDKYGYEISQAIGERGSSVLRLPEGSLYPTLYRLERMDIFRHTGNRWENAVCEFITI